MPIFADAWESRALGTTYPNGAQSAIGLPDINDWGAGAAGFANWTFQGFSAEIVIGYKGTNSFGFISGGGYIEHQTQEHYQSFSIYCLVYPNTGFGTLVEILNKDPIPTNSGSISLCAVRVENDGSISFVDGSRFNAVVDNSAFHVPYAIIPQQDWSLVQVIVTISSVDSIHLTISMKVALNGVSCIEATLGSSGYLISGMFDDNTTANFFRFYSLGSFGLLDSISMYAGEDTVGIWPDYAVVPDGTQRGYVTQALTELLESASLSDTNLVVTQGAIEVVKFPKTTGYVTQGVIELIKSKSVGPPPPPPPGGSLWQVKEC